MFGDKAVEQIGKSSIPKETIERLVNSKKYMEGRGLNFEIRDTTELETIKKLLEIKIGK